MKILAHSKDPRSNELITYQGEIPTYLLPEILKFKKLEVTWNKIDTSKYFVIKNRRKNSINLNVETLKSQLEGYSYLLCLITITTSKPALMEFFDKCLPKNVEYKFKTNEKGVVKQTNKTTDIHIQQIAEQMYDLYNESKPVELKSGEWHLPFKNEIDYLKLGQATSKYYIEDNPSEVVDVLKWELKIVTALISNPSETDYSKLIEIHDQLLKNNQLDTFVHCARVMSDKEYNSFYKGYVPMNGSKDEADEVLGWCENYKGFISYKKIIEDKIT